MKSPDKEQPGATPDSGRRKYSSPVIRTYGTIRAITRNVANKSANSDGGGMKAKTG